MYTWWMTAERGLTVWAAADESRRSYIPANIRSTVVVVVGCVVGGVVGDSRSGSERGGRRARDVNERQIMRQTGDR